MFIDNFERRGKLKKKSEKNDTFKERIFLLEGFHIYYYKDEKTSKWRLNLTFIRVAVIQYD